MIKMEKIKKSSILKIFYQNSFYICSVTNHFFESSYISPRLGILHLIQRVNVKENKLFKNNVYF